MLILLYNSTYAQLKNGDAVPDIQFAHILNAPIKTASLSSLRGKVVLIEFWATWCGSCLAAMPHLTALQAKFPDKLQVIAVSAETTSRIQKFLKARPTTLWLAIDSTQLIANTFPHQLIPHTVLISTDGRLIANTDPNRITADIVETLIRNEPVTLKEKKDNLLTYEELLANNFHAADTVRSRFSIQPELEGAPGFSTNYLTDSTFNGRRITAVNCSLGTLYRIAYNDFPYNRTISSLPKNEGDKAYCLDIIAADKAHLLPDLRKKLAENFDVHAALKLEIKDAYVLRIINKNRFKNIPRNTTGKRTYYARHGEIDQQAITLANLAEFLESYGTTSLPVLDETQNTEKIDIKFSFQPEDPASLTHALENLGLALEKVKRKVDMLYIW